MRLLQLLPALLVSTIAHAAVTYTFTYTRNSGAIQDFSFLFTTPTFIASEGPFAFEPFSFTDGDHTWTMAKSMAGLTAIAPISCFYFVTAERSDLGDCMATTYPPDGAGMGLFFNSGLPTQVGTYQLPELVFGGVAYAGSQFDTIAFNINTGTGTLVIISDESAVPEPSTIVLILLGLAGIRSFHHTKTRLATRQ